MTSTRSAERTQFLTDVFTTALEGGVNYWASVREYRHTESPRAVLVRSEDLVFDDHLFAWVPAKGAERLVVDLDVVARGVNRIAATDKNRKEYLREADRRLVAAASRENDMGPADMRHGDIDAGIAELILQVALFDEVVYG